MVNFTLRISYFKYEQCVKTGYSSIIQDICFEDTWLTDLMLSVGVSNGFREESTSSQANSVSAFASRLCRKMEENVWCLTIFFF